MDRRRFIALTTAASTGTIIGCTGTESGSANATEDTNTTNTNTTDNSEEDDEPESEPEPEGGDGHPYTHYDLEVTDEFENGQPIWIDQNGRMYGRDDEAVVISDDWWRSTQTLYDFTGDPIEGHVESVIVPESGEVIASVGGKGDRPGTVTRITGGGTGYEDLYQFDYGYVSNSLGHVEYGDVVIISCYQLSEYDEGLHGNEVILSSDGGRSFEQILEPPVNVTNAANNHIHDVEYDPYAERVWVAMGDHGNSQLFWSDDLGQSWDVLDERGQISMVTQVAAFKDCVVLGTDGYPEGILRWERDGPNDTPENVDSFVRPHVQIEKEADEEIMEMYARRRWHIREDLEEGRELCLMPFGFSPMNENASESVVLASVDGDEWYEIHRTDTRDILLTNVIGPLSMDGERRTLISDSNQGEGYQIDGTVPKFWE